MNITVNEKKYETTEGASLSSLLEDLSLKPSGVAMAINDEVIPRELWASTLLSDGMNILVIRAASGG
ncbi:MAG: sulfur carrier protein ThiS [Bacteroidales bacterium]|jgi:sulfur carrier protein|nr:sulfur carrier protein ThiS [Bacteroidales bacterium]